MLVNTELGGDEAREHVDDIEPQWLLVCKRGELED